MAATKAAVRTQAQAQAQTPRNTSPMAMQAGVPIRGSLENLMIHQMSSGEHMRD